MAMRFIIGAALLLFVSESECLWWPQFGRCPKNVDVQQNFDVLDYMGKWYQQGGYNTGYFQGKGKCASAEYEYLGRGLVSVYNEQINLRNNESMSINGTARLEDASKDEGKLIVTFPMELFGFHYSVHGDYWVLDTDYGDRSIVYSCQNFLWIFHYRCVWALSRTQDLDEEGEWSQYVEDVNDVVRPLGIDWSSFTRIDQHNCPENQY